MVSAIYIALPSMVVRTAVLEYELSSASVLASTKSRRRFGRFACERSMSKTGPNGHFRMKAYHGLRGSALVRFIALDEWEYVD